MNNKEKIAQLKDIYAAFDADTRDLVQGRACTRGCSFCCREAGSIDITTLEGMVIRQAMDKMPKSRQKTLTKAFRNEIKHVITSYSIHYTKLYEVVQAVKICKYTIDGCSAAGHFIRIYSLPCFI